MCKFMRGCVHCVLLSRLLYQNFLYINGSYFITQPLTEAAVPSKDRARPNLCVPAAASGLWLSKNVVIPRCLNMVSHRTKRILRYLGPFLFFLGLAYTAFYPERKLLQYKGHEEKTTTLFISQGAVTLREEIPLASCRVSKNRMLNFYLHFHSTKLYELLRI